MELHVSKISPPVGALFVAESTIPNKHTILWGNETKLKVDHELLVTSSGTICRYLARQYPSNLYGSTIIERTEVDHWLTFAAGLQSMPQGLPEAIKQLDTALSGKQYLVGQALTMADFAVWGVLFLNPSWNNLLADSKTPASSQKWFKLIAGNKVVQKVVQHLPAEVKPSVSSLGKEKQKDVGKFVELPGAEMGKVVVRFPPEASGYLHIGHAKAALLNQYYQQMFEGTLIMRFDDTNPAKENAEFERVILEDLEMLQVKYDKFSHTSDHFELCLSLGEKMIREDLAYADDTEPETMKLEREQKKESKNRNASVEKNLEIWEEMKKGSDVGVKYCIRAKIDMQSVNGCMRDPTIFRCKNETHIKTGDTYKVYPTYDFACPIVDSIEGVTHALRTTEYHDRDVQYYWFCDALKLRKPHIYEYARLCMNNTVLSKRKLTWFVNEGLVDGWDDPRMPTVRGVLRRGMTVEGLRQFIVAQGSSRSVVNMGWDKIWSFNKKVVDPVAARFTAVDKNGAVPVHIAGAKEEAVKAQKHPKDEKIGFKTVWTGPKVLIESADADVLKEGENATFINYGNVLITKIHRKDGKVTSIDAEANVDNKDYKKTTKLTWLADTPQAPLVPVLAVDFDQLINKPVLDRDEDFKKYIGHQTRFETEMLGDPELTTLKKGDIIQLQRKGFFICDEPYYLSPHTSVEHPVILYAIPDGKEAAPQTAAPSAKKAETAVKSAPATAAKTNASDLSDKIVAQGDKIRLLKVDKADKAVIDLEVKNLLALKVEYKAAAGSDWKPGAAPVTVSAAPVPTKGKSAEQLNAEIAAQGEKVRDLKAKKADKAAVDAEVKALLSLKVEYKAATGSDWKPGAAPAAVSAAPASTKGKSAEQRNAEIAAQGEKVRDLKAKKADKATVDAEVKALLSLKVEYKAATGSDWKPGAAPAAVSAAPASTKGKSAEQRNAEIAAQGEKVRDLKAKKADKATVDAEVKALLSLKVEYKAATGSDWKPGAAPAAVSAAPTVVSAAPAAKSDQLNAEIAAQGEKVRDLKAKKADKATVDAEVKALLSLKAGYKAATGSDWKPSAAPVAVSAVPLAVSAAPAPTKGKSAEQLNAEITAQGEKVRDLKAKKADKATVDAEVKALLSLKAEFRSVAGSDWKPGMTTPAPLGQPTKQEAGVQQDGPQSAEELLLKKVQQQGDKVRDVKTKKAPKEEVDKEVAALLELKKQYKDLTGKDVPSAAPARAPSKPAKKEEKKAEPKKAEKKVEEDGAGGQKKQTRLGLEAKKEENLPDWYSQVITKSELIEYYDVSGCYILRPWAYSIWESIRDFVDGEIKKLGVKNCYFPIFVSKHALEKEKEHIADFAPEVAWVTKSGDSDLAEHIAIRPTSETVMYPAYAKWIQSYRDLPMRLNQWNNVVRWEFKHPQPFLRTREFLWQEGHTAFATREEAVEEVHQILDLYAQVYTDLLAIPVVKGKKTEKEKFAGADFTTTVEAFVPASGRGIQGATSHLLGQNFSKMFDIGYEHPETKERTHVWQNSWGMTTRTIGVLVMVHADNKGLVLPPRVACTQIIIVPCGITAETKDSDRDIHYDLCKKLEKEFRDGGLRVEGDYRDNYSPGWKYSHWELKGVPVRIELGPRDIKKNEFVAVRRDTGEKLTLSRDNAAEQISKLLTTIHESMLSSATEEMNRHIIKCLNFTDFVNELDQKNLLLAPFCGDKECEENIKKESAREESAEPGAPAMGAKSLCCPFAQPEDSIVDLKCVHPRCERKPKQFTLFGRSY